MAFIDFSVQRHWNDDLDWHPKTTQDVKDVLHRAYNKARPISIIYGDPVSGACSNNVGFSCKVGISDRHEQHAAAYMFDHTTRRWGDACVRIYADRIVAIRQLNGTNLTAIFLYAHPRLHLGIVSLQQDAVMVEESPDADARWAVLIDGQLARTFAKCDSALDWIKEHGLTVHSLEDLYAE